MFDAFITYWARVTPYKLAFVTMVANVTYAQFDRDIDLFAARLGELDIAECGPVGVQLRNPYAHWLTVMGLSRLGIASASLPTHEASVHSVVAAIEPGVILADTDLGGARRVHVLSQSWVAETLRATEPLPARPPVDPEAIGCLTTSSGTTGRRKVIAFTWQKILERAQRRAANDRNSDDVVLVLAGNDTNFGFSHRIAAWIAGAAVAVAPEMRQLPVALATLRPTVFISSPGDLLSLLQTLPANFQPVPGLRARIGGGAISAQLAQAVRLRLAADLQVMYSSTEGGSIARGPAALVEVHPGSVGYRLPWAQVEAVGPDGQPCAPGVEGEIRTRGDEMITGYHGNDDQTSQTFRHGWFYPGDIGAVMPDGEIRISGRTDRVMNIGGMKLMPSVIEDTLRRSPGVADVAVFTTGTATGIDTLWAAIVRTAQFDHAALVGLLREEMPSLPPIQIAIAAAIPRNDNGKIELRQLRALAALATDQPTNATLQ